MKVSRLFILSIVLLVMVLVLSMQAHAALENLGVDSAGNRLIYDSDLDITWYDYTNDRTWWGPAVDWADVLDVNFGGIHYTDWRLPDSDDCWGYDCTGSEMGHLYHIEGITFSTPGLFTNLQSTIYWSGVYAPPDVWTFNFSSGHQASWRETEEFYSIAVRSGRAVVPEPISATLFIVGGATLGFRRFLKKRKTA